LKITEKWDVSAKVSGGGIHAQADAIRMGVARALVKDDPEWKKRLRAYGFMTRDSRMVERKKYGLKKARRAPQWTKR
jgi:small subunit ribosomal protein S9